MAERYKVLNILKRPVMQANGTFTEVFEVQFETAYGVKSSVQIAPEKFNPKAVKAELDKQVEVLDEIMKLTG